MTMVRPAPLPGAGTDREAPGVLTEEKAEPRPLPLQPPTELPRDSVGYRVEAEAARSAAAHRAARARAARQADRARGVRVRQPVVVGVRDRGDPARPRARRRASPRSPLVVPITIAMLVVLGFLILSYRQTIKAYPTAGGAYMVTRDNFGLLPAQVAGVALLTDYVLTVVGVGRGRAPRRWRRRSRCSTPYRRADLGRVRRAHRVRQPAGRAGVGHDLRGPDVLLHRQHGRAARRRGCTSSCNRAACRQASHSADGHGRTSASRATASADGRDAVRRAARLRVRAAPRSPGSRRSPTACPRSASRSGRTPARRSSSWARCSASCSSGCRCSPRTCTSRRSPKARRP